jgi:hypothetical protein
MIQESNDDPNSTTIKMFCFAKDNVKRMKMQATGWEQIFVNTYLKKD